jgi:hypothetical protein
MPDRSSFISLGTEEPSMFALRSASVLVVFGVVSLLLMGCLFEDLGNHETTSASVPPLPDDPQPEGSGGEESSMDWERREMDPILAQEDSSASGGLVGCYFNGIPLWGEVEVVESFADIEVEVVGSFPDLMVEEVTSFPDECGEWEFVESFPDFTIEYVESFPDITIEFVDSFPGI